MTVDTASASASPSVLVLGGGLAGLTLALQLRGRFPDLPIRVIERRRHPVPEAAFKVGESTVEIGAHYFANVLGLKHHLETQHIKKFGFRFFFSHGREDIDRCPELGATVQLPTPAWQIDRGRFENFLGERARALGIEFIDGATVRRVELAEDEADHRVVYETAEGEIETHARWVIDASGRAGLLKRQLGLAQDNGHHANAVWFRVQGRIDPHAWSDDADWLGRCTPPERWRSTNHLCGPGYWVWLIPLASGSHSVGIVADAAMHPLATMNSYDKASEWLRVNQPRLARALEGAVLQDFAFFRDFSYGCRQVFSPQRWALTGEAGVFLDPFYSPGSDFIAIANTYVTALIAKDLAGEEFAPWAGVYEQLYFSFYESTLAMYRDQYALFGDPRVMSVKVIWDYTYYWGVLGPLFFANRLTDLPTLSRLRPELAEGKALNAAMQPFLRAWGDAERGAGDVPLLDQSAIDWFAELNRALMDDLDDGAFKARLRENLARLKALAAEIVGRVRAAHPQIDASGFAGLLDDAPALSSLGRAWYERAA